MPQRSAGAEQLSEATRLCRSEGPAGEGWSCLGSALRSSAAVPDTPVSSAWLSPPLTVVCLQWQWRSWMLPGSVPSFSLQLPKGWKPPGSSPAPEKIFSSLTGAEPSGTSLALRGPPGPGLFLILVPSKSGASLWRGCRARDGKSSFTPSRVWTCGPPALHSRNVRWWFPKLLKHIPELICCKGRMASGALKGIKTKISNFNMQMAELIH